MDIYNISGIPENLTLDETANKEGFFVFQNGIGDFIYLGGEKIYEIETLCFELRNLLAIKMFGSISEYHRIIEHPIYSLVALAGIDAEIRVSKDDFKKFVDGYEDKQTIFRMLYFFDIDSLIGTLQNCVVETHYAVGEFYKQLNINNFLINEDLLTVEDGIQYAAGGIVTNITSLVNRIFICLYSILDFITKIVDTRLLSTKTKIASANPAISVNRCYLQYLLTCCNVKLNLVK